MYIFIWLWFDFFKNKLGMHQLSWLHSREEVVPGMTVVMKELE